MNTKLVVGSTLFSLIPVSVLAVASREKPDKRPNILIILADDLGYGDVQCYNPDRGKIPTPNIDRLASQGMRFTDGHSSSGVSSPSRYTLLTGRYHWRTSLQSGIVGPFGEPLIAPGRLTIASLAKQNGYRTACIGKWHLGWDWPIDTIERTKLLQVPYNQSKVEEVNLPEHQALWSGIFSRTIAGGPVTRGFDTYFGTDVPNWPPFCFIENDRTVGIPSEYLPAENLLNNLASVPGPALKDWKLEQILPTLGDKAVEFLTKAAKSPQPFFLFLPLTSPHTPLAVNETWRGKSALNSYADFVMETDALVGRVLDALERSGAANNTIVIFTSDNGCATYIGTEELESMGHFPSGPLRGYKGDAWEGGHRIPFIVSWPGMVKAGSTCSQLVQQADLMATFAQIFGIRLPDTAGEDSFSLLPLLKGKDKPVRRFAVNCALEGVPALRDGPWKLILGPASVWFSKVPDDNTIKLFNLNEDPGETKNLADELPERVAVMKNQIEKLITDGRSTPGTLQKNDVEVHRYPDTNK